MSLGSFFKEIGSIFKKSFSFITNPSNLEKVFEELEQYVPKAVQIVEMIDAAVPNKTIDEAAALAGKIGTVFTGTSLNDVLVFLENTAVTLLAKEVPSLSTSGLKSLINLAVLGLRAGNKPASN